MNMDMHTTWGSTVKLGAVISIVAILLGGLLVSVGDVPQAVVVIGVMVVGFTASMVTSAHTARPRHQHVSTLPVIDNDRRAA